MNQKFGLATMILRENGFLEYENIDDMIGDQGEEIKEYLIGYFQYESNVTYRELENIHDDFKWTVSVIHSNNGEMIYYTFESTKDLKNGLNDLIEKAESEEHLTIYKTEEMILVEFVNQ